ncbi:hypothetical protein J23TS9_47740 [Paenibacillus sp. J23TS9]|uniref:hypothetical protein n=1 Tax=Paenibacillus sp. J23TS9 TaxID=2807193 RepID=UPI001B241046|nr:hypothetical protein [Paenibacillus sp. J23TS9]GIP29644.1 hypothetical protein J23TS9_47740 [Paenibacillus sp. J23TS9]
MFAYIYKRENRIIIDRILDVISVSDDQINGQDICVSGIDTTKAGILVSEKLLEIGGEIPRDLNDYKADFANKSTEEEVVSLRNRLAELELVLVDFLKR